MKNKKILSFLVCLSSSACLLAGCETSDEQQSEIQINSLYDGMVALYQTQNYTLDIIHVNNTFREEIPSMIFTKDYIGYDGAASYEDLDVLYNDGTGIYRVSYGDDFMAGEYILDKAGNKCTNLWDNSLVYTMLGEGGKYIKANVTKETTNLTITDKDYKIKFAQTIIGNLNNFANIDSLTAKYENNKVIFDLSIDKGVDTYKVTLKNVGNTASSHLKMFIKNDGKAFVPNNDLSEMRRLINLDNFVQRTYMISEGEHYWAGYQFFTPHYYFTTGNDPMVGNGYMEFNYKESPELDNDFDMWGIYLVNISKSEAGEMQAALVSTNAYNSSTVEIEECCHYPSRYLDILNNLEYLKAGGDVRGANYEETSNFFEGESKKYYFIDEALVKNFISNFSLDTGFEGVVFNTVVVEIGLAEQDKDSMVCFHAIGYYPGDSKTYDIILPLYGFGDAKRNACDLLYSQYNNNNGSVK